MKKYDLIFFLGQSNMQGQSEIHIEINKNKRILEYKYLTDSIIPLSYPIGENIKYDFTPGFEVGDDIPKWLENHIVGASVNRCYNLLIPFLNHYTYFVNNDVVACHIAKGSTKLDYWVKQGDGYKAIIKKGKAAISKIGKENIDKIYAVFLQGESDAVSNTKEQEYFDLLTQLKNDIKKELCINAFAIIKVGNFAFNKSDEDIQNAQEKAVSSSDDFIMLTRVCNKLLEKPEEYCSIFGHYNNKAFDIIGKIAGTNLAKYKLNLPFIDDSIH